MPYSVKCNVKAPHKFLRMGAMCVVVNPNYGSGADRIEVLALARNGRRVLTWVNSLDLNNYRASWFTDTFSEKYLYCYFPTKESAQNWADYMNEHRGNNPFRKCVRNRKNQSSVSSIT